MSGLDDIADILAETFLRGDDPEEVIRRHPELADELRAHFAVLRVVDEPVTAGLGEALGVPRRIGDYRIVREIGRGGMGVVYEAEQGRMRRRVALKVLSLSITGSAHAVKRFQREARAAGRLHHTNIVPVYDMDQYAGQWFYAMELVEGRSLSQVIAELRPSEESLAGAALEPPHASLRTHTGDRACFVRVAEMFAGVAEALELAHQEGIVHRDVKPGNVLLDADGVLKIVDFGLARVETSGPSMTRTGDLLGTPAYMSPEQAMAKSVAVDHRTDVYSLGATLYEVLTLRAPFRGSTLQELCSQIITKDPVLPRRRNRQMPRDLETIVCKAMEKDRDRRYQTAREFARDLRAFAEGGAIRARRIGHLGRAWRKVRRHKVRSILAAALLLLAAAGGLLGLWAAREAELRAGLEYLALVARAERAMTRRATSLEPPGETGAVAVLPQPGNDEGPAALFTRAIGLLDRRPEAWLGRALAPGRTPVQRLADLDAARARGLPERTFRLVRADALRSAGRWQEASAEEERATALERSGPREALFEGRLLAFRGRRQEALPLLDAAVEGLPAGNPLRYLALHTRALVLEKEESLFRAIEDLAALDDRSPGVRVRIASLWRRLGHEDEAERRFGTLLRDTNVKGTEEAWMDLCTACRENDELEWRERAAAEGLKAYVESAYLLAIRALTKSLDLDTRLELADRAAGVSPRDPFPRSVKGGVLRDAGRHGEALEAFEEAIRLGDATALAHSLRGIALRELGRLEEALRALDRALELDPTHVGAHVNRTAVLDDLGRHADAIGECERAIELDPRDAMAHYNRGVLLSKLKRHEEAVGALERSLELDPGSLRIRCALADQLGTLGRTNEGLEVIDKALELDADHVPAHVQRARLLATLERFEDSLGASAKALELDPRRAAAHKWRGYALFNVGRLDEALQALREAVNLAPDAPLSQAWLARTLNGLGRPDEAVPAARHAIRLDTEVHEGHCSLGAALAMLGHMEDAVEVSGDAVRTQPDCWLVHAWRGRCLMVLGRYGEAVAACNDAIRHAPRPRGINANKAHCLNALGRHEGALAASDQALALDPEFARGHRERALALTALGRTIEAADSFATCGDLELRAGRPVPALDAYERALTLTPRDAALHFGKGRAYRGLGSHAAALESFEAALGLDPRHALALAWMGDTLRRLDREAEAREAYDRAVRAGLDAPDLLAGAAWLFAIAADPRVRDPQKAIALAERARKLDPTEASALTPLAAGYYRAGRHAEAVRVLEEVRSGRAYEGFFLAMALWHLDEKDRARQWYDESCAWTDVHASRSRDLERLRAEAAALLGVERK